MLLPLGAEPSRVHFSRRPAAGRSSRDAISSGAAGSCSLRRAASIASYHMAARMPSRLWVGERTVIRGPSGTGTSMNSASSPVSIAPAAERLVPRQHRALALAERARRRRSRPGARCGCCPVASGRCGRALNQKSPTFLRANSLCTNGIMPPMWSLSMWVITATSMCSVVRRQPGEPRLEQRPRVRGAAVDEHPPRGRTVSQALHEQAVAEARGQGLDADRCRHGGPSRCVREHNDRRGPSCVPLTRTTAGTTLTAELPTLGGSP